MNTPIRLLGVPFDGKSSFKGGARFAPHRIREEMKSPAYNVYSENRNPVLSDGLLDDLGDLKVGHFEELLPALNEKLVNGVKYLIIGGDHSITYPIVEAMHAIHGPFHVLHFDAHGDLYDEFEGDRFSHACPFARIMESNLVSSLTQVGIRTLTPDQDEQAQKFGVEVYEMKDVAHFDPSWLEGPLYISLDLDILDPAYAPGLSHREPGGVSPRMLIDWLHQIKVPVIGADLVEYNPIRDIDDRTATVCYKLVKELLDVLGRVEG